MYNRKPNRHDDERAAPPSGFMDCIRSRDQVSIALEILRDLETLAPIETPGIPMMSPDLLKLMSNGPRTLPDASEPENAVLRSEHDMHCSAVLARVSAKSENQRRLRSTLWAEQLLRSHQRQEHEVLRAFNRDVWFVRESASRDVAEREAQVREHAC